jgi:thiol-disulfide isomerase/thioredoxin
MPRLHRRALGALFAVLAGFLLYGFSSAALDAADRELSHPLELLRPQLLTRAPAPDFELPDRMGRRHSLKALAGRAVLLNFWSSDCPPCIEELPSLIHLDEIARHRNTFSVVTVTVDESWDDVRRLFQKNAAPRLLVLFDPDRAVVERRYGTSKFPETYLIDRRGFIRARYDGQRPWHSPLVVNLLESL